MAKKTISFSEIIKGWTSFFGYEPDMFCKLNNRFFSIKDGQLWMHNDESSPIPNTFYGVKTPSKIKMVFNEANGEDKIFKTIVLEGNRPWEAVVNTNFANSTIKSTEFEQKESRHFAYLRKNEDVNDFHGNAVQGIGVIKSITTTGTVRTITYNAIPNYVSVGDKLYQLNGNAQEYLGIVETIDFKTGEITVGVNRKHTSKFNLKFN
jgi:hypothetical protein